MFENLTNRLENIFSKLKQAPSLTKEQVDIGLVEIRQALLEADVSLQVTKNFIERVKPKAIGQEIIESITPGQMVVKIVNDEGDTLPNDGKTFGRLMVKGPAIIERYYKSSESALENGWFDTGDVSTISPDGYMRIVDRSKDVIKSGGEWISSIDLENTALGCPGVLEACVVGVAHEKWDERPLLFVVKNSDECTKESVLEYLSDKVAKWWLPDDVIFIDELPHGATGKLLKTGLREDYKNHLITKGD